MREDKIKNETKGIREHRISLVDDKIIEESPVSDKGIESVNLARRLILIGWENTKAIPPDAEKQ